MEEDINQVYFSQWKKNLLKINYLNNGYNVCISGSWMDGWYGQAVFWFQQTLALPLLFAFLFQ